MLVSIKAWFILVALLFVFFIQACDHNNDHSTHQTQTPIQPNTYKHIGLSQYNPAVKIRLVRELSDPLEELIASLPSETLEDNRWSQLYEQVLGIQLQYDWTAKGDFFYQKLGVAITSGDIPDVVRVNAQQLRQLTNAGLIQDLTEVYNMYATPLTKDILSQEGMGPFETATFDGKLMGIPEVASSIERAQYIWIRTDWLERLGLDPPKSMDDVLEISKAFTIGDPDQNGEHDTFGLAITQYLWDPVMGLDGFMAGYGAYPNIWLEDESGTLVFGGIQPEVKKGLKALQEMYGTGQMDQEFVFKDGNKVKKQVAEGKIGMLYGEQWGSFLAGSSRAEDPDSQWQAYPVVSDSESLVMMPLKFPTDRFLVVRKDYEYPEAIVKMINLHLEKNWGETANYNTYYSTPYPVWQLSPVTPFPVLKNLEAFRQVEEARLTGDTSVLQPEAQAIQNNIDNFIMNNDESGWGWERTYGPEGAFSILEQYILNDQLLYDRYVGAPTKTMIEMKTILDDLMHDTYVNIILGRPLDEFDQFVEDWKRLGGARMTAEVNQWYSTRD